jgi:hypothetical protein
MDPIFTLPFAGGKARRSSVEVLTGFLDSRGRARGRPVGLAINRRGAMLVADDVGNGRGASRPLGSPSAADVIPRELHFPRRETGATIYARIVFQPQFDTPLSQSYHCKDSLHFRSRRGYLVAGRGLGRCYAIARSVHLNRGGPEAFRTSEIGHFSSGALNPGQSNPR